MKIGEWFSAVSIVFAIRKELKSYLEFRKPYSDGGIQITMAERRVLWKNGWECLERILLIVFPEQLKKEIK